jgi:hypothetical protein
LGRLASGFDESLELAVAADFAEFGFWGENN